MRGAGTRVFARITLPCGQLFAVLPGKDSAVSGVRLNLQEPPKAFPAGGLGCYGIIERHHGVLGVFG